MNTVRELTRIRDEELRRGVVAGLNEAGNASWHMKYRDSAWCFVGNLVYTLSEGDVIAVFSQWGEIEDIHLVREGEGRTDKEDDGANGARYGPRAGGRRWGNREEEARREEAETQNGSNPPRQKGQSRGFAFVKYEDARSAVLAVDNMNGTTLLDRTLRVDHVEKKRLPRHLQEQEEQDLLIDPTKKKSRFQPGHAYEGAELANSMTLQHGRDLFATAPAAPLAVAPSQVRTRRDGDDNQEEDNDSDSDSDRHSDAEDGTEERSRHHRHKSKSRKKDKQKKNHKKSSSRHKDKKRDHKRKRKR